MPKPSNGMQGQPHDYESEPDASPPPPDAPCLICGLAYDDPDHT